MPDWKRVEKVLSRVPDFLWVGAILFMILGLSYPQPLTALSPYTTILLGSVILAMGLTLTLEDFKRVFTYPKSLMICILSQYQSCH
jgi:BASS family bile acid:Na+ symporter